jgi:hypothetical protein
MTKTWNILNLEKLQESGEVIKVVYSLSIDNGKVSHKSIQNINLERTDNSPEFISFEDLTQEIVLDWVQEKLGEEGIDLLEQRILRVLPVLEEKQNKPKTEKGLPWK